MQSKQSGRKQPVTVRRMLLIKISANYTYTVQITNVAIPNILSELNKHVSEFLESHHGQDIKISRNWERLIATSQEGSKESLHFLTLPPKISGIFVDFVKKSVKFVLKPEVARNFVIDLFRTNSICQSGYEFIDFLGKEKQVFVHTFDNSVWISLSGLDDEQKID